MTDPHSNRIGTIFEHDIAHTLNCLETLLETPEVPDHESALRTQVAALLSWGEVLNIDEFVSLAQATVTLLRACPHQTPAIIQLALIGFKAIYQLEHEHLQPFQAQDGTTTTAAPRLTQSPSSITDVPQPAKTNNAFTWQTGALIFTLPSAQVIEIIIPKSEHLLHSGPELSLGWQTQIIPIFCLQPATASPTSQTHIQHHVDIQIEPITASSAKQPGTVLILHHDRTIVGLEIRIDSLLTTPDLVILPPEAGSLPPSYLSGYMPQSDGQLPVIDVAQLLQETLTLPPEAPTPGAATPQPTSATMGVSDDSPNESSGLILVVDDSLTLRQILSTMLHNAGHTVIQAQDGQEALAQLQQHPNIQLVVCDVEMPHMNGFDFLRHCRQDVQFAQLPVVMLSTYSGTEHRELASQLGANAYFAKPYTEAELLTQLHQLMHTQN